MKLCKDCVWCSDRFSFFNGCTCNVKPEISLVSGVSFYSRNFKDCEAERSAPFFFFWMCGKKGRFFKAAEDRKD